MRVLVVCSHNSGQIAPFIEEQVAAIRKTGLEVSYFQIEGKGITGYLGNRSRYKRTIKEFKPDIIHAHYGFSGLFANLQRQVPVITTFHGSDINEKLLRTFSFLSMILSQHSIFVSVELATILPLKRKHSIIPCGLDITNFSPIGKDEARKRMNYTPDQKLILFSSSASHKVKNFQLAKTATELFENSKLIELKGFTREQVNWLLNACDVALMTSFSEGSPQFIKEAMVCNCPIVSTNVGNVSWLLGETEGCFITNYKLEDVSEKLQLALDFSDTIGRTKGRDRMIALGLDNDSIAGRIIDVYKSVLKTKN